jgi:hypothetical protein
VGIVYSSEWLVCATFPAASVYSCCRVVLGCRCNVFSYLQYVKYIGIIYIVCIICMLLFLFKCIFTYVPLAVDSSSQVHPVVCHKHKCLKVSCCHNKCFDNHSVLFRSDFVLCYKFQFSWDHHQEVTYDTYRVIEPLIRIHIWCNASYSIM